MRTKPITDWEREFWHEDVLKKWEAEIKEQEATKVEENNQCEQ